jgi:phosphoserine phosphatase
MQRFFVERRIRDVHDRLVRARQELAVLDEQYAVVSDAAEDARMRSLVSETPLAAHEYAEVRRHADAMARAREALVSTVVELEHRRDELLQHVGVTGR